MTNPKPTPLSPAAQAVLNAWLSSEKGGRMLGDPCCLAAALCAAADRVEGLIGDTEHPRFTEGVLAAAHLLDLIAAELEAPNV
jgi:hypothetical protein